MEHSRSAETGYCRQQSQPSGKPTGRPAVRRRNRPSHQGIPGHGGSLVSDLLARSVRCARRRHYDAGAKSRFLFCVSRREAPLRSRCFRTPGHRRGDTLRWRTSGNPGKKTTVTEVRAGVSRLTTRSRLLRSRKTIRRKQARRDPGSPRRLSRNPMECACASGSLV